MRVSEFCQKCRHSYREHMHLKYDLVRVPLEKLNEEVNQKLNANRGEKKTKESRTEISDNQSFRELKLRGGNEAEKKEEEEE